MGRGKREAFVGASKGAVLATMRVLSGPAGWMRSQSPATSHHMSTQPRAKPRAPLASAATKPGGATNVSEAPPPGLALTQVMKGRGGQGSRACLVGLGRGPVMFYGCSTVVLAGFTSPATRWERDIDWQAS